MSNETTYKKVYVYCPPGIVTGGPETLHSIVSVINDAGGEAYVFYDKKKASIPEPYKKYNVKVARKVEDSEDNLIIVSECFTDVLHKYKHIHKAVLFLSVLFYLEFQIRNRARIVLEKRKLPLFLYPLSFVALFLIRFFNIKKICNYHKIDLNDSNLIVCCNGEVNKQYLINKLGVNGDKIGYICGPINTEFLNNNEQITKENVVAYNPKKGLELTQKIIGSYLERYSNARFVPIEKMSPKEVHELLMKSKVYIDFGSHPGPERIPREAVISNCNILTSRNGSAFYHEDVPIPDEYKFDTDDANIDAIVNLINDMIENYANYQPSFDEFKHKVLSQSEIFKINVINTFLRRQHD